MMLAMPAWGVVDLNELYSYVEESDYASATAFLTKHADAVASIPLEEQVRLYNSLGVLASRTFHAKQAISFYKSGLSLVAKTDNVEQLCIFVENLAALYVRIGDSNQAAQYLKMAELLYGQQNKPLPISLLNNMGSNCFYQEAFDEALSLHKVAYQRALSMSQEKMPSAYYGIAYNLAWDLLALGKNHEAADVLRSLTGSCADNDVETRLLYVTTLSGDSNQQEEIECELKNIQHFSPASQVFVYLAAAEYHRQHNEWQKQADYLIQAFNTTFPEDMSGEALGNLPPSYRSYERRCLLIADALCRAGKAKDAWSWIQRSNARAEIELAVRSVDDNDLDELLVLQRQLAVFLSRKDNIENSRAMEDLMELERRYETAKETLRENNHALWENLFSKRINLHPDDLDQIRYRLANDTVLLEVAILDDQVAFFLCRTDAPVIIKTIYLKGVERKLKGLIMQYRQLMSSPGDMPTAQRLCKKLYDLTFAPVAKEISELQPRIILFAPSGLLRYISFATLFDGDGFLIEKYNIANISGYDVLRLADSPPKEKRSKSFIAFCNPDGSLPASDLECKEIGRLFDEASVFSQHKATLQQFQKLSTEASFLHLATHGVLNVTSPEKTYLVFADDKLYYKDMIVGFPMMNNLVMLTLSACNTASSNPQVMDDNALEIYGMAYQFVRKTNSGATLATLWPVSDVHTRLLMKSTYKNLLQNFDATGNWQRARSLNEAQRQMLATSGNEHPFFWGAFVLIGDYR